MADAYNLERQNNSRLDELSNKVSALRGVTVNIYDNARDQSMIESNTDLFSSLTTNLRSSAGRVGRMAQQGNKVAIFKLAGILVVTVLIIYWVLGLLFRWRGKA